MRRKIRKIKRRLKKGLKKRVTPKTIGITTTGIIILALFMFLLTIQPSTAKTYEITETDVLSIEDIQGKQVSVKGVVLGDSLETVIEKLGYPNGQNTYPPNIINMEYGERFGLEETGLILHLVDNKVQRMTLKEPFNEFLVGKTKIVNTKQELFNLLGTPDSVDKVPIAPGSALLMSLYTYEDRGIAVLIRKDEQNALTFTQ